MIIIRKAAKINGTWVALHLCSIYILTDKYSGSLSSILYVNCHFAPEYLENFIPSSERILPSLELSRKTWSWEKDENISLLSPSGHLPFLSLFPAWYQLHLAVVPYTSPGRTQFSLDPHTP